MFDTLEQVEDRVPDARAFLNAALVQILAPNHSVRAADDARRLIDYLQSTADPDLFTRLQHPYQVVMHRSDFITLRKAPYHEDPRLLTMVPTWLDLTS